MTVRDDNTCGLCGQKWRDFHTCPDKQAMIGTFGGNDAVNPAHYNNLSPEPWDVIVAWGLPYCLGNVVKYVSRAGRKSPDAVTDLKKARAYLDREIKRLEAGEK